MNQVFLWTEIQSLRLLDCDNLWSLSRLGPKLRHRWEDGWKHGSAWSTRWWPGGLGDVVEVSLFKPNPLAFSNVTLLSHSDTELCRLISWHPGWSRTSFLHQRNLLKITAILAQSQEIPSKTSMASNSKRNVSKERLPTLNYAWSHDMRIPKKQSWICYQKSMNQENRMEYSLESINVHNKYKW